MHGPGAPSRTPASGQRYYFAGQESGAPRLGEQVSLGKQ